MTIINNTNTPSACVVVNSDLENMNISSTNAILYKVVRKRKFRDCFDEFNSLKTGTGLHLLDFLITREFQVDFLWDANPHDGKMLKINEKRREERTRTAAQRQS
jgi:hypothetical protein